MAATNYLEDAILKHVFEGAAYTQPEIWVGLSLADPGEDGLAISEPAVLSGYARVRPVDATGRWLISETDDVTTVVNKGDITFPEATDDWGEITHMCIFDKGTDGSDGELLLSFPLDEAKIINTSDTFAIFAGNLAVQLD